MKVFRFMSKEEFEKFKKGEELVNNKVHTGHTTSIGFCFINIEDFEPEYAYHFLSGIVSPDICAIFETDEQLNRSQGTYATPYGDWFDSFVATEYCPKKYSNKNFKLLRYAGSPTINDDFEWNFEWKSAP